MLEQVMRVGGKTTLLENIWKKIISVLLTIVGGIVVLILFGGMLGYAKLQKIKKSANTLHMKK